MNSQIVLHDSCLGGPPGCVVSESAVSNNGMTCVSSTISGDAAYIGWMCTNNQVYLASTCLNSSSGCSTTPVQVGSSSQVDQSMFLSDGGRFLAFQQFNDPKGQDEVYLYDSCKGVLAGCTQQTIPISANSTGALANSQCTLQGMSKD